MNKINILFTICFLWIASIPMIAQDALSFSFAPSNISANVGDEIDIEVRIGDGFDELVGMQFGVNYNGAALEYISNDSEMVNPLDNYSIAKRPNKSELINVWFHFSTMPPSISLTPGTLLYTLKFRVLSDIGNSLDILCGEGEVECEFFGENAEKFSNITVDQQANINGGGASENNGPIIINMSDEQAATGTQSCVQFEVEDFVDVSSMQFSLQYDETVLSYSGVLQNLGNCPMDPPLDPPPSISNPLCLEEGNFSLFEPGTLTFSFADIFGGQAFTLDDGTVIIDLCFDVIGAGGSSSSITIDGNPVIIQVGKEGQVDENFGLVSNVGSVTVTGSGGPLDVVEYTIGSAGGDSGTNVCVPVTVTEGFTDILGFGWSIDYDAAILDFTNIQNINPAISSLGANESSDGTLAFIWNAPFVANSEVTLANGTVLYEMCFDVIGNSGMMSPLTFTDVPNPIETVKVDGPDDGTEQDLTIVNTTNGNITVTNSDGFNLIFCEMDVCPNDQVCIPLLATGATEIGSITFTLSYDTQVLTYTGFNGVDFLQANEPPSNQGNINVLYFDLFGSSELNLEDCEQLAEFCFDVIGAQGTSSAIAVTDEPTDFQASKINEDGSVEEIEVAATDGAISVDCGGSPGEPITTCVCGEDNEDLTINTNNTQVNDITCNGDQDGSIILNVSGGVTPYSYSWSNVASTKDITNLGPGNYTVSVTDNAGTMVSASFVVNEPQVLQPNSTANNTTTSSSDDGSISLNVSGGVSPYTYLWTGGLTTATINDLAPDTYNVTITDANNCTLVTSRTVGTNLTIGPVGGPGSVAGTTIITDVLCFGENTGSIQLALTGGVPPFNISWNNSANQADLFGLAAGNYCVTVVDTNGESIDQCFDITGPASSLDIITNSETPQSLPGTNDGAIDIDVTGGEGMYTYNWNGPGINNITTQDISNLTEGSYTVNVTDERGCVRSRTFNIETAGDPLSINSGTTQVVSVSCFDENDGAINPAINGGTAPYTYSWSGPNAYTASTANISNLAPGSYQLTVTDAAGMTAESVLFLITQPQSPLNATAQITEESSPGQNDGGIMLTVTGGNPGYNYAWNNFNNGPDNFALTMGTYTVTITDQNGCEFIESYVVPFDADPLVINAQGSTVNPVRCFGDSNGSISPSVNGGFPPYNYDWGFSTDKDISGLAAGEYTLTVTDQNGVSDIQTFLVNSPTQLIIGLDIVISEENGNDGAISITASGGTPAYSYSWNGPGGFTSTASDLTNLTEGTYTLTLIDANGCTVQRIIPLGAVLNIENKFEIDVDCFGECTGEIDIVVVGGQPPYLYSWSGPNGFDASTQDVSGLCAGTYAATISDALGQEVFTTCRIDEPLLPLSIANNPTIINEVVPNNGSINITVNGGTPSYTYQWSNEATSEDLTDLKAGSYRVTVTDGNGCIIISPEYVVERTPLPLNVENLIENDPTCAGDCNGSVTMQIQGGDAPYSLVWDDGVSQTLSTANPTYARNSMCAGSYSLTISDANGQELIQPIILEDLNPLEITSVLMAETNGNDGAINTTVTGGQPPYTYDWAPSTLPDTPDQENLTTGLYIVTVTDANSCILIESFFIDNNVGPLTIGANPVITLIDCFGDSNGSIDISVSGGAMPYTFTWSDTQNTEDAIGLGAGTYFVTVLDANGVEEIGGPYVINAPTEITGMVNVLMANTEGNCDGTAQLANLAGGQADYTITWASGEDTEIAQLLCEGLQNVTVVDALGCVQLFEFTISQDAFIPLQSDDAVDGVTNVDCNGNATGSINLNVFGGIAPYTYAWSNGATTPNIGGLISGFYTVTITDTQGTSIVEGPIEITEPDLIEINFNVTPESGMLTGDGSAQAIVIGGVAPYTYQWNDPNGCNTFECTNLTASTYFVVVQDANECIAVDSVVITNEFGGECMETRNIITPDQDGKNDSFLIQCAPNSINTLEIYNRWGQLVFLADNYDNTWEGTNRKGQNLPAGGYFYVFILEDAVTGQSVPFKGHITILRE